MRVNGCDQYFPSQPFAVLTVDQFDRPVDLCENNSCLKTST